jgi:6-phosphogluconolactonase
MNNNTKYKLQVFPSIDALNIAAADFIIQTATAAIAARGRFAISLSGGNTPSKLFALMTQQPYLGDMPWDKTFIFWGDERCVPLDDPRNNAHVAKSVLLDKINIPAGNIHRIPTDLTPADAAMAYEKTLRDFFDAGPQHFDLIMLGLGSNGHTASLFPHTPVVDDKTIGIREVYLTDDKAYRISMTAPLINLAHHILFLATGADKASTVKTILQGDYNPAEYPAQLIQAAPGVIHWYVDREAAAEVEM